MIVAAERVGRLRGELARLPAGALAPLAALLAVLAVSAEVRTRALGSPYWIDEGLSVGIASHGWTQIPGLLRQDGSPPLYYVLLHGWMALGGRSEAATHALSLVFALATVPLGLWLGRSLFGSRAGWACAVLCGLNPLLSAYAQETRMYSLLALLSLLLAGAFVLTFVYQRRRFRWVVAGALAALIYSHGWGLFLAAAAALAFAALLAAGPDRRALVVDGSIAFGFAALAFVPWVPTLLFQIAHTGAPWASSPHVHALTRGLHRVTGGAGPLTALLLTGAAAGFELWSARRARDARAAGVLLVLAIGTPLIAWAYSQHTPAWATRYLTIVVGPGMLLAALAVARAGIAGIAAVAIVAVAWFHLPAYRSLSHKSNAHSLAARLAPLLRPGDVVVAGQPESAPLLRYELGPRLRYATPMGAVDDPGVMDWRDALARLRASAPGNVLAFAARLPPGGRVALVRPVTSRSGWRAHWTSLVKRRVAALATALRRDPDLRRVAAVPPGRRGTEATFRAVVYARRARRAAGPRAGAQARSRVPARG